jgi:hypothetical protein
VAGIRGAVSTRRLAAWLRKIEGRIVDGLKLSVDAVKANANRAPKFRLAEVRNDEPSSEEVSQPE